jgi:hypothetical protein
VSSTWLKLVELEDDIKKHEHVAGMLAEEKESANRDSLCPKKRAQNKFRALAYGGAGGN